MSDHGIDLSCFSLLTDDMLKDMIPMIGHRAKFRANLEEWRKVLALANNQASVMVRITYLHFTYFSITKFILHINNF